MTLRRTRHPWKDRTATARGRTGARLGFAAASLLAAGAAVLGGCTSARNELGTVNSDCYIAIPAALSATHHHGHLHGIRLVTVASLRVHAPLLYRAARSSRHRAAQVCLVAFGGDFSFSDVERPIGRQTGHVAVVELDYPSKRLLATLIATHPPLPFGHSI